MMQAVCPAAATSLSSFPSVSLCRPNNGAGYNLALLRQVSSFPHPFQPRRTPPRRSQMPSGPRALFSGIKNAVVGALNQTADVNQSVSVAEKPAKVENDLPSWEDLSAALPKELDSVKDRLPWAKERRFGLASGQEPRVVFYRDNSSWCPYCERLWLQLEEKQVPYTVEKINMRCYGPKPEWYTRMVPSGLLPAVKIDGELLTESMDIMIRLEQEFTERPLLPKPGSQEAKALQGLLRLERQLFGSWLRYITSGWGDAGNGQRFEATMAEVDSALKQFGGPYFLGKEFSMIDAVYAPFLERIAASVPYYKGLSVRSNKWTAVDGWYDAMDTRPAYQAMKSDDFTHVHDLPPQIGECYHNDASKDSWDLVDGKAGSWTLPLKPETTGWGFDEGTAGKDEAAWNLVKNHAAVVTFASRKLRNEAEAYADSVDVAFRYVAKSLIDGADAAGALPAGLPAKQVRSAAEHLRDNVGVPRDMSYPAARQFRAHLNWAIDQL